MVSIIQILLVRIVAPLPNRVGQWRLTIVLSNRSVIHLLIVFTQIVIQTYLIYFFYWLTGFHDHANVAIFVH